MADFMIRFSLSNLFLGGLIVLFLLLRRMLRNSLTSRMQYHLWYVIIGLLFVPFLPLPVAGFPQLFSWMGRLKEMASSRMEIFTEKSHPLNSSEAIGVIQDFTLSVSKETPSIIGTFLFAVWLMGILAMILLIIKSKRRFQSLKQSALPLQSEEVRILYRSCLDQMKIAVELPIYSTAFLKSPMIAGLLRPSIYLPIYVISDYPTSRLRYMLLHELQHYRCKDALTGSLMDLTSILYWFNPLVWYALREMRSDREVACDAAVLDLLEESDYKDYGSTLLGLAEKISLVSFPFTVGISGNMRQMQKRIMNITSYKKPSSWRKAKGCISFCVIAVLLLGFTPMLSTYAADQSCYRWDTSSDNISMIDLSSYFDGYSGSFVLYDLKAHTWSIYNMDHAVLRTAPNSTYKIYDALFGLEECIITPHDSLIAWDGKPQPFEAWNSDQDLYSAMQSSVNWYFQKIDEQLGRTTINHYVQLIEYGNEEIHSDLSSYWMQSSLKISPIEQVELLTALYQNQYGFAPENINAVKKSICLFSSEDKNFYGKTGTGCIEGQDVNGWFVGFLEVDSRTCFFATNIQNDTGAAGSKAADITMSILSDMNLWN
ncbi:MAG: BlaR1 family beta-lactam sensor/signal transducer [Lachnospiraceae bacterium]|nr:BlaR1 family beta-lactam sensor/signal transducer [Lachnospiraceae bacterium]